MSYKLKLELFEGPLDLLLYLIKKDEIDISNIPIAQVTEQYMEYIEMMKSLDLEIVGDFLVMAATLMQIKSRMLLPPDPSEEVPEDPRDELVRKLEEYQSFKQIAEHLRTKESQRQDLFERNVDQEKLDEIKSDAKESYFETSLFDLITAFSDALKRAPEEIFHEIIKDQFTVEQKIHEILHILLKQSHIALTDIFKILRTKMEVIVTFLAVLELIRLKEIIVGQKKLFGEIEVLRNTENLEIAPTQPPSSSTDQS